MINGFIKTLLAGIVAFFFAACTTSLPVESDDDSSSSVEKISSSSEIELSSSEKNSSSSVAKSSSSENKSSSSVTESSSSEKKLSSSVVESSSTEKKSSSSVAETSSSEKKSSSSVAESSSANEKSIYEAVEESGLYTTRDSVAAYLCKFDKLPGNYVGKNEGKKLYESKTGKTFDKWNFNPWTTIGVMIGGDNFDNYASNPDNYHAALPEGGYHEADVDYSGANRGTKRLVYQPDCVIYYTSDHYEKFTKLDIR